MDTVEELKGILGAEVEVVCMDSTYYGALVPLGNDKNQFLIDKAVASIEAKEKETMTQQNYCPFCGEELKKCTCPSDGTCPICEKAKDVCICGGAEICSECGLGLDYCKCKEVENHG